MKHKINEKEIYQQQMDIIYHVDVIRREIASFSNKPNNYNEIKKSCNKLIYTINKYHKLQNDIKLWTKILN